MKTIVRNIHIVQPPNNSKLPKPSADAPKANNGKQQGESNAVIKSPIVPNLSTFEFSFKIFDIKLINVRVLRHLLKWLINRKRL